METPKAKCNNRFMFHLFQKRLFDCPCCGFPTLQNRGDYDICIVCWWEDDDPRLTMDIEKQFKVGGPNGHYSITQARQNFLSHGHMYDFGKGIKAVETPSPSRQKLMDYINLNRGTGVAFNVKKFRKLLNQARK